MDRTEPAGPRRSGSQTRIPLLLVGVAVAALLLRVATQLSHRAADAPTEGLVRWQAAPGALAAASKTGKPVLYDFTAAWCPPCRLLDSEGWNDVGIAKRVSVQFIPARVMDRAREDGHNPADIEALQHRYEINAFPTILIADASGRELARSVGWTGRDKLNAFLDDALKKAKK